MAETFSKTTVIEIGSFDECSETVDRVVRRDACGMECESVPWADMVPDETRDDCCGNPIGRWTITVEFEPVE